jgi:hypothetical protein
MEDYNNTSDEMMCVKERVAMFEKSRATPKVFLDPYNKSQT